MRICKYKDDFTIKKKWNENLLVTLPKAARIVIKIMRNFHQAKKVVFSRSPSMRNSQQGDDMKSPQKKARDPQSLLPLTIKQILECEARDAKFKVDGKDVSQVTIVGMILSIDHQTTNTSYVIDDSSGKINVRLYVDQDDPKKERQFENNQYVRVVGNVRPYQNQKSIVAFQLIPIVDFNELTCHLLEVIHCHLVNTKGPLPPASSSSSSSPSSSSSSSSSSLSQVNSGSGGTGGGAIGETGIAAADGTNFSPLQQAVLEIYEQKSGQSDAGIPVSEVCARLNTFAPADVRAAIDFLTDEGHLYSTIDEEHYKSTNNST